MVHQPESIIMGGIPPKGKLQAGFNTEAGDDAPQMLYHAIPVAPQGNEIRLSEKYGAKIPAEVLQQLNVAGTDHHPPLVFATAHLSKALAFGLDGFAGDKLMNMAIHGTDDELVIVTNRNDTMGRKRNGAIYSFSGAGFAELPNMERQLVSATAVPFSQTVKVMDVTSAEDLMRAGLQILSFRETARELWQDPKIDALLKGDFNKGMREMIAEGRVVWENHARGINPSPALARQLGIDTAPTPALKQHKM